ncbi:---NA--- [Paramuricea clavata]|uniref:---NA n=1 Tax=Paramuricea clavata TaxID=317549 RepID=A0A6S7IMJ3_PARCT|nr:---NA--- [Paramuricea clavata]
MYNSRKPKVLFRPARWLVSSLRYGFLMPMACGRRMFAAKKDVEDFSSHIQWVNSKIKDPNYHIESLADLAKGTSLLQLVDSCLKNSSKSRHEFVFGEMDDSRCLSLVKVRVSLNLMESKGVITKGEFSADLIAAGDVEHIRGIVVKLALFPTTLQRGQNLQAAENGPSSVVTEVW